jgi:hypothetical protein
MIKLEKKISILKNHQSIKKNSNQKNEDQIENKNEGG